jgi:hypothetical protein
MFHSLRHLVGFKYSTMFDKKNIHMRRMRFLPFLTSSKIFVRFFAATHWADYLRDKVRLGAVGLRALWLFFCGSNCNCIFFRLQRRNVWKSIVLHVFCIVIVVYKTSKIKFVYVTNKTTSSTFRTYFKPSIYRVQNCQSRTLFSQNTV